MSRATNRPDTIAKQMFFVGLLGLPWLWIVNICFFFDRVYGRLPCCGDTTAAAGEDSEETSAGILGMLESNEEDEEEGNADTRNDCTPSPEEIQKELCKWVKGSTIGSFIYTSLFLSWIIVFQVNKDNFGQKWFVYSQGDEILTGW
mmetsp:Transcript_17383/g.21247  ORF Transcript_17383/g.21247 Transcript_17383/m.21247 type:complete len:146 (+) Transcript_17383:210-647(+)